MANFGSPKKVIVTSISCDCGVEFVARYALIDGLRGLRVAGQYCRKSSHLLISPTTEPNDQ